MFSTILPHNSKLLSNFSLFYPCQVNFISETPYEKCTKAQLLFCKIWEYVKSVLPPLQICPTSSSTLFQQIKLTKNGSECSQILHKNKCLADMTTMVSTHNNDNVIIHILTVIPVTTSRNMISV